MTVGDLLKALNGVERDLPVFCFDGEYLERYEVESVDIDCLDCVDFNFYSVASIPIKNWVAEIKKNEWRCLTKVKTVSKEIRFKKEEVVRFTLCIASLEKHQVIYSITEDDAKEYWIVTILGAKI